MTFAWQDDFIAHAVAEYPRESVGVVVSDKYIPLANTSTAPLQFSVVLPDLPIDIFVHSHPDSDSAPSAADMASQQSAANNNIPWAIAGVGSAGLISQIELFGDSLPIPDFFGRSYLSGVRDCWTLVRDWYRINLGVVFENLPRDKDWYKSGELITEETIVRNGLDIVDKFDLQVDDILVMRVASRVPNHVALYVGNNLILQHLQHKVSHKEPLGRWFDNCLFCARLRK